MTIDYIPAEAAVAIGDMLDCCAKVQRGQHVLILAAIDGLHGGQNLVDQNVISWIHAGVQSRGAHPTVMWVDMPVRRTVIWPDIPTRESAWSVPPIVKSAMKGADLLISHVADLSSEEHLKELPELLKDLKLPMVRNMATTAPLMMSSWARTPHDLIAEIRNRTAELVIPGEKWSLHHTNGTHLEGTVGPPPARGDAYAYWRRDGYYRPFPDGIYPAVNPVDTNGVLVFDQMMPVWARNIGIPVRFSTPVRITVEKNRMKTFKGGDEARAIEGFLHALARLVGEEDAFEIRGPHGGVHPHARVSASQCPDADYREFIESFHPSAVHMHLGQGGKSKSFPFNLHTAAEVRGGATLKIGDRLLHDNGQLGIRDHPGIKEIASRYGDRPGID
jgi:hypothetical protein